LRPFPRAPKLRPMEDLFMMQKSLLGSLFMMGALLFGSCSSTRRDTGIGAGGGAAAGALIGGLANGWKGAVMGAAAGAVVGGGVGHYLDKRREELAKVAETKKTRDGLLVKLKNELLFQSGKKELKPEAVTEVSKLGDILAKYPDDKVKVVGHTDNVGKKDINLALSKDRAAAVMDVLKQHGVKESQIVSEGRADSEPIADNSTADGRAQNRRVELHIQVQDPEAKGGKKARKKSAA
jgi:outer membrane protein OmpA-like peptidoglycan-associated protein